MKAGGEGGREGGSPSCGPDRSSRYKKRRSAQRSAHSSWSAQVRQQTDMRVMERTFREQLFFLVLSLSVLKGDSRYIEVSVLGKKKTFNAPVERVFFR